MAPNMGVISELEANLLKRHWSVPEAGVRRMSEAMGLKYVPIEQLDVETPISPWLKSSSKQQFERFLAQSFLFLGGSDLISRLYKYSGRLSGVSGRYDLEVGFPGLSQRYVYSKVRTMQEGAEAMRHPWEETSLIAGLNGHIDPRILPGLGLLRKTSFDELPQAVAAAAGIISVAGLRGYTKGEREATEALCALSQKEGLSATPEAQRLLQIYLPIIARADPLPAVISPLSATYSKDTLHLWRMYADLRYSFEASAWVDFWLFFNSFPRRLLARGVR